MRVNFLIIGVPRSGTTSVYYQLQRNPEIFLKESKRPEPHFFVNPGEFIKGSDFYERKYLSGVNNEKLIGDASTSTIFSFDAARRIKATKPSVKLICGLRNPVDRMISEYRKSVDAGKELLSFKDAITFEEERLAKPLTNYEKLFEPNAYLKRGYYAKFLKFWMQLFSKHQIFFYFFDDLIKNPSATVNGIENFLGVDQTVNVNDEECHFNRAEHTLSEGSFPDDLYSSLVEHFKPLNRELAELLNTELPKSFVC